MQSLPQIQSVPPFQGSIPMQNYSSNIPNQGQSMQNYSSNIPNQGQSMQGYTPMQNNIPFPIPIPYNIPQVQPSQTNNDFYLYQLNQLNNEKNQLLEKIKKMEYEQYKNRLETEEQKYKEKQQKLDEQLKQLDEKKKQLDLSPNFSTTSTDVFSSKSAYTPSEKSKNNIVLSDLSLSTDMAIKEVVRTKEKKPKIEIKPDVQPVAEVKPLVELQPQPQPQAEVKPPEVQQGGLQKLNIKSNYFKF